MLGKGLIGYTTESPQRRHFAANAVVPSRLRSSELSIMMRFVLLAALVAFAVAAKAPRQRNKAKKFQQMVNPYIEDMTVQPPTGVFIKGASYPIPRSTEGFISLDLDTIEQYLATPSMCPQNLMVGDARLTIQPSENKCTLQATFIDQ